MRVQALMADAQRSSFTFQDCKSVEGFNDGASFRLIKGERSYTLPCGILRGFNAVGHNYGIRFEYSGFVQSHPFITRIHCRFLPVDWEIDELNTLPKLMTRGISSSRRGDTVRTILLIVLILLLLGALPTWPYSTGWGYYPSGGLGLVLLILVILVLTKKL
jgi:hypothetical protein